MDGTGRLQPRQPSNGHGVLFGRLFLFSTSVEQSFLSGCCDRRLRRKAMENGAPFSVTVADAVWIGISPWQPCGLNGRWGHPLNPLQQTPRAISDAR